VLKLSVLDMSPVAAGGTHRAAIAQTLELARAADRLGYTRYWLAEHHNTPGSAGVAPEVLAAAVAACTTRLRVGSGGVLLSHYSALKVAEQFRTLEALYPGRIDLGIGRAPGGSPLAAAALRDGRADAPGRFPEQFAALARWATGEALALAPHPLTSESTQPPVYVLAPRPSSAGQRDESIAAMPLVESTPQLWLLGSSDHSAQLAAQTGAALAFAHFLHGDGNSGAEAVQRYKRDFRASALGAVPQAIAAVYVVCAATNEAADRIAGSARLQLLQAEQGIVGALPSPEAAAACPYSGAERLQLADIRKRMIVGAPGAVRRELLAFARRYGVDEVLVVTPAYRFSDRLRSHELLAEAFALPYRSH
jgi:luciferase family oxidoreductase group 1